MPPLFTVAVLSYNRGQKALNLVRTVLPQMDPDWELLVLNNCSANETEAYEEIATLAASTPMLRYVRHPRNLGFHGNYNASFHLAGSNWIMLLSDEDFPNPDMIRSVAIPKLRDNPSLAVLRGSIAALPGQRPGNACALTDQHFTAGECALLHWGPAGNYFSGVIYNRPILSAHGLLDRLQHGLEKHAIYPHLYLDTLASAVADVDLSSAVACFEGPPQAAPNNDPTKYAAPYSYGSRLDQHIVLRDALHEAVGLLGEPFNLGLFCVLYLNLCNKSTHLISRVNAPTYLAHHVHLPTLRLTLAPFFRAALFGLPGLDSDEIQDLISPEIDKIIVRHSPPAPQQ